MREGTTFIGLDAHKNSIHAAVLFPGQAQAVADAMANEPERLRRWARKIQRRAPGPVLCGYEAGPLGYALQRQLGGLGLECQVVAPALIPVKPGERVKTDRRDARKLAELLRAGLLTEVHPPTPPQEAVRDLCRAREAARQDLTRCQQRLSKFLLRRGIRWTRGRNHWTRAHLEWLRRLRLEEPPEQAILDDSLLGIEQLEARIASFGAKLEAITKESPYAEPVGWLRCFRGIDTVTALTIIAELHDFRRFHTPRALMAYLGAVPSERSSAEKQRRGAITKAGNAHVRRVLIEAAWHYRHRPAVGDKLRKRRQGQPARVIALADRAQQRLNTRYQRLLQRGKPHNKVVVAVARELVGFLWAALDPRERETA